jgi:lipopolysaccharide heptosyltransferase II
MGRSRAFPTYAELLSHPVRRILIIKPRALGDVVLSSIVTRNLRDAFPVAHIAFLTESASRDAVEGNPFIDEAIVFHPRRDNILALFRRVHRSRFDLVFDLFCNPRTAQITFATRARFRAGYPFRGRAWAYNCRVQTRADKVHNAIFNLDPLAAFGIPITDRSPRFPLDEDSRSFASEYLPSLDPRGTPLIALNAHCAFESKKWGSEHFAGLGDALVERYGAAILLLHGPGEEDETKRIQSMMRHPSHLAPRTTVRQLGALLECCDFIVTNDTGPMHIAAAVGVPVLAIFGPTNPALQGPFSERSLWVRNEDLDCLGCNMTVCPIDHPCMRDLGVDRVLDAFEQLQRINA